MSGRLLEPLTRPELDALLAHGEHASVVAHVAACAVPLDSGLVEQQVALAGEMDRVWQDMLDESIWRMWHQL